MFFILFFTLDKSRDTELQNGILYTAFEEQWESYSAFKVDKLVSFEKMAFECFGTNWRATPIQHRSHPLKP
jgi:hypothetical protein